MQPIACGGNDSASTVVGDGLHLGGDSIASSSSSSQPVGASRTILAPWRINSRTGSDGRCLSMGAQPRADPPSVVQIASTLMRFDVDR